MAAPAVGVRRRWLGVDYGRATIDWSHPFAAQLRFVAMPGRILGSGVWDTAAPAADTPTVWGNANGTGSARKIQMNGLGVTDTNITVAGIAQRSGTSPVHMVNCDRGSGLTGSWAGSERLWQFRLENAGVVRGITFDAAGGVVNNVGSAGSIATFEPCIAIMAISPDKTFKLYARTMGGSRDSAIGSTTSASNWHAAPTKFDVGGSNTTDGWNLCSWLWARTFSVDEMQQFLAEPFAMLRT